MIHEVAVALRDHLKGGVVDSQPATDAVQEQAGRPQSADTSGAVGPYRLRLAKPCFDVGLHTDRIDAVERFWVDEIQLELDQLLPTLPGVVQHRYWVGQSVVKLNHRPVAEAPPSGYSEVIIAREGLTDPVALVDPDGNRVRLVPPGFDGVTQLAVIVRVRDLEAHRTFYDEVVGLEPRNDTSFSVGTGLIKLVEDPSVATYQPRWARGWRYLTFQIFDARAELARITASGGRPGTGMEQLGDIARVFMLLDPDGNWIEMSQRANLTGPLDP